jgi:hypothetical protein
MPVRWIWRELSAWSDVAGARPPSRHAGHSLLASGLVQQRLNAIVRLYVDVVGPFELGRHLGKQRQAGLDVLDDLCGDDVGGSTLAASVSDLSLTSAQMSRLNPGRSAIRS